MTAHRLAFRGCHPDCPACAQEQETAERRELFLACEAMGHAWSREGGDPIHGVCGLCFCGSKLYTIDGRDIEP